MATPKTPKKPAVQDWDWKDLLHALHKQGWSLRQIGIREGYPDGSALGEAARRPYPLAEKILAHYLGVDHPMQIWPSRYDSNGNPNRRRGPAPTRPAETPDKATIPAVRRNPHTDDTD